MARSGRESGFRNSFSVSLLTLAIHALFHPALAAEETSQDMVVRAPPAATRDRGKQNYAVPTARCASVTQRGDAAANAGSGSAIG